jgi:hypothetical protein
MLRPLYLRGKTPRYPIGQEAERDIGLDAVTERKNFVSAGNRTNFVQIIVSSL